MNIPSPTPHDFLKEFLDSKPKLQAANAEKNLKKQVRFQLPDGTRRVMTNADFMLYAVNNGLNVAASPEKGSMQSALVDKIRNSFSRMDNYKAIVTSLGDLYRLTPEMKHLENLMQKGLTQQNTKEWYNARENAVNSLIDAHTTTRTYYHVQLNDNGSVMPISKTMYDFAQMVHEKRLVELKQQTTALLSDKSFRDFSIEVNNNGGILVGENTGNSIVNLDDNNHLILQELSVDNPENIINTTPFDDLPKDRQTALLNEAMENAADLLRELNINRLMDQLKTNALPVPEELADITLTNGHQVKLKEVFRHEGDGPQLNYNSIQVTFIPNGYVPYQIERKILDTILTQAQQNQLGATHQASQSVVSTPTSKFSLSEASDQQPKVSQTHERHNNTTYDQLAEKMRSLGLTKVDLPWGDTVEHDGEKIIIHGHHEDATPKDTLFNELTNIQQSVIYNHVAETIDKIDRKLSADIMKLAARMVDRNTDDIQIDAAATLYNIPNNKDGQNIEVSVLKMDEKGEFFVMTSEGMQHPLADIYFADQITLIDKANHALNYDKKTEESIDKLLSGEMMPKDMESLLQKEEIKAESEERYKNMLKDVREHIENAFPDSWISLSDPLKHEKTLSITIDGKDTGISPIALPEDFKEKQTFGFVVQIPSDDNKESAFMAAETAMEYPDIMKVINEKSVLFYDINDALDFQKQLQNLPEVEKLDKLEQQAQNALPIANPQWQRDNNEQIEGAKLLLYGNDSGIRAEYLQPAPYEDTKKEKLELAFAVSDGINAANIDSLAVIYSKQHPDQQMFNNGDDDLTVKFLDVRHALQFQSFVHQLVNAEPQLSETQTQNMTDIKNRYPDSLILNRNGNSYEAYGNDAQKLSALLELPINYERGFAVTKIDARELDSALPEMISKGQHTMVVDDKELSIRTQAKVINEIGSQLIETLGEGHHSLIGHPPTEQLPGFHLAAKNELGYINITSIELSNDKIPTVSLNSEDNKTTMSLLLLPLDQQQNLLAYAKALNAYQNFQQSIEDHLAQQNDNPEIQKAHQLIHELGLNFTPIGLRTPVTIPADLDDWGSEEEVLSHVMLANDKIMTYTKRNDAYDGNNGIDISNLSSGTQSEIIQKINEQLSDNDRFMTVYVDTQNVPGWAINGLINGDYTGLSHKEIQMIEDFYQNYPNHIFSPRDYDNAFDTNPAFGEPTDTIPVDIVRTATPAMLRQEELQTNQIVSINDIGSKLIDLLGEGRQSLISDTPVHNLQGFHLPSNNDQGYINIEALDLTNKNNPSVLLNSEDNKVSLPLLSLPQDQQQNLLDYAERLVEHQLEDDKQYLMDIIMANKRAEKETIIDIPGNLYVFLGDDNSINFGHYDMPGEIEALDMVDIKQQREIVKHALNNADDEAALREWAQKEDVHITFDPLENFRNSFRETGIKALPVRFNNDDRRFMDNDGIVRTPFLDFSNDKSHRPETMIAPAAVEYQKQTDTLLLHGKNINGDNLTIPLDPILHRKDQKQAYDIVAQQLESTMLEAMTHIQRIGKLAEKSIQDQKATEAFIHNISNTGLYLSDGGSIEIGHYDNEKKLLSYKHKDKMGWFEDEGWVAPISIAHRIHNGDAVPVLTKNQVDTSHSYPHIDELMVQNAKQQSSDLARLNEKFLNTVFSYSDGVNTEKAIIIDVKQKTPDPANPSGIELSAVSETGAYFNIIPDSPNNKFTQTGNKLDGIAAELSKMGFSDQTDKPDRMLNDPINFCRIKGQRHNADNAPLDELLVDFGPNHFYLRQQIEDGGKGPYKASYEIENLDLSTKEKVVDINIDLAYDIMRQQISRYDLHKEQSHSLYKMENLLKDVAHNSPLQTVELISPLYNIPNNNIEDHENPDAKIIDVTMFDLDDKGNIILHGNGGPVQLNALNYTARYETTRRIANDITYQNLDLPIKQTKVLDYYHTNDNVDVIKPFQKPVTLLDKNGNYQIVEAAIVNNDNKIMLYSNFKDAVKAHDKLATDNNDLHGIPFDNIITQDQRKVLNGAIKFYESPEKVRSTYINAQRIVDNQHLEGQPIDLDKMRPLFDQPKLFPNIIGEWQPVIPVSMDSKVIEQIDRLRNGEKDNQQVNENESKPQIMLFQYLEEAIDYANGGNSKPMRLEWFTEEAQKQILSSIIESQNNQNLSFSNNMSNQNSEENKMKTEQKPQTEQQTVDPEIKKHEKEAIREAATAAILATIGQSIPKLKLADDQHITLDTNKGSSIEVQTISVTKNNSLSLYGEMDGTKKSISANQLTDESINKLAAHVEAMAQSRTMTNEAAVAKPTEQKVATEQKTETQQVQQPEQKNGQNAETKQAETPNQQTSNEQKQTQPQQTEQKADQTQERKVEPIEIKPDSKVEFNISKNPVLDKVYDIKLYVDGEKKGGHHLSLEDRKDFFDKKVTGPELLSKYFEKELAGQKLPDNIERHHFERKQDAAEQKTDTKQAQTQQTEQKADQTREQKSAVKPDEVIAAWKKAGEPDKTTFIQRENDKEKFYQTFGADAAKVAQILNRQAKPVSSESNADLAYISINQKDMPNLMKSLKEQGDQIKVVDMNGKYARVLPEQQAKKADDYSKYQIPENKQVENFKIWPHNGKVFMNAEVNGNKLPTKEVSWDDRQAHKEGKATPEQLVAKHYAPAEMNVKREQSQSKGMSR